MFRPQIEKRHISAEEQDLYLFMMAARWADDIGGNKESDRGRWHYTNIPYKPEGQAESQTSPDHLRLLGLFRGLERSPSSGQAASVGQKRVVRYKYATSYVPAQRPGLNRVSTRGRGQQLPQDAGSVALGLGVKPEETCRRRVVSLRGETGRRGASWA